MLRWTVCCPQYFVSAHSAKGPTCKSRRVSELSINSSIKPLKVGKEKIFAIHLISVITLKCTS
jgi:hypothetical protein